MRVFVVYSVSKMNVASPEWDSSLQLSWIHLMFSHAFREIYAKSNVMNLFLPFQFPQIWFTLQSCRCFFLAAKTHTEREILAETRQGDSGFSREGWVSFRPRLLVSSQFWLVPFSVVMVVGSSVVLCVGTAEPGQGLLLDSWTASSLVASGIRTKNTFVFMVLVSLSENLGWLYLQRLPYFGNRTFVWCMHDLSSQSV